MHTAITSVRSVVPKDMMVPAELIHFNSFDGLNVPAYLFLPTKQLNGQYPVVINIHGGPESQYRPGFSPLTQYFVSKGFAVLAPNVRGSTGYGKAYQALDDKRMRLDSVKDLAWLHRWIDDDERLDGRRVALMGGSYGGYMVLAGLAFYPDLWVAGIDIVGIANLVTFLENTSPYRRKLREHEYGSLERDKSFLKKVSPINSINSVSAPLMIIHGANDPRVPLNEAEQVYEALTKRGIECELHVYLDEGHGIAKLKNRLDIYPKVSRFLDHVFNKKT